MSEIQNPVPRLMSLVALSLILCPALFSCVGAPPSRPERDPGSRDKMREVVMDPLHLGLQADPELGLFDFDAATLFHEGLRLHESGQPELALKFYDRLLSEFPDSRYRSAAAFNAGRCAEDLGRNEDALERFSLISEGMPRSKDWVDTMFRIAMLLGRQKQHRQAVETLERLLARENLSISDQIDAMILKGENLSLQNKSLEAEAAFRAALREFRRHGKDEYLDPAPAAQAEFRLAELVDARFAQAPLRLPEETMRSDLEAKAQLLLQAQSGFLRSMRYGDPDWATAAGYRIGRLYLDLHQAMDEAPVPADLGPAEVEVYRDMLRERLNVLLRKALKIFEMTIQLAERTRSDNDWTRAAQKEMEQVKERVLKDLE